MDSVRAKRLTEELVGCQVGPWRIESQISFGKSAVVLRASDGAADAAVKVFDPELVERFGKGVQARRIDRELKLRGQTHPHLVQILDGGECPRTRHLFVAMSRIDAPSLGSVLVDVPRHKIFAIIAQVASAARFLEGLGLAHRDIKPDNISISPDFECATLMDLGVLRPIGEAGLTDHDQRLFIGTLRYSAPEYLFRIEDDSLEGWRAVTFYQLGAVLHDLIQRFPIFQASSEPYARLVEAVKYEIPKIDASDVPAGLVVLVKNCLQKRPDLRLRLVDWPDFELQEPKVSLTVQAKDRIKKRHITALESGGDSLASDDELRTRLHREALSEVLLQIETAVRHECSGTPYFPPLFLSQKPGGLNDGRLLVSFEPSADYGLTTCLSIWFEISVLDADSRTLEIRCAAALSIERPAVATDLSETLTTFEGAFEFEVVSGTIQQVLYLALDYAQNTVSVTPLTWIPLLDLHKG